jgi:non-heme chloroperoxidase
MYKPDRHLSIFQPFRLLHLCLIKLTIAKAKISNKMKTTIITIMLAITVLSNVLFAQGKRVPASAGRLEFIEVEKNVRLHVTDIGEGQPIVLIHGWPLSDAMYELQYQSLSRKGFRVIGITLRGFGQSDKPFGKYDFDVFSDDIKVVLEKLKIEKAVLGGFSMGGAVVLHYVTKYNGAHISKLALFGAAAPSWKQREGFPYGISDADAEGLIKTTLTSRQDLIAGLGAAFQAKEGSISKNVEKWLENINLEASPYAVTESITALRDLDLRPELSKVKIPTAIFHGTQDKLCDFVFAEELHKGIKNSYIVKFENSGHALFIEEAEKFNSELEKFAKN